MADHVLKQRTVPLDDAWDVIVVGGGPAGVAAATASGREGARTLLIEAAGALGGMGTLGLVPWFCGYHDGEKIVARGLAEHVLRSTLAGIPHLKKFLAEELPCLSPAIDPELLKRIYDDMVEGAGVQVLYHTQLCAVETDDSGRVDALIVSNKQGLSALRAKTYVDCTGDADLAAWAGASFEKGDADGSLQPATHCFMIGNVDEYALPCGPQVHFYNADSPIHEGLRSEKYPLIIDRHSCNRQLGPGVYGFNTGHIYDVDNTDPVNISQALPHGRKMAAQYHQLFREHIPAYANSMLIGTGAMMGVRETRRVIGDYVLTIEDYLARRSFPDEICRNAYGIDVHGSKNKAVATAGMTIEQMKAINQKQTRSLEAGESMGVPYRCLTPKGLGNVLVAGRSISTDRQTNGSTRIMACCLNTGEAAGIAAAMAAGDSGDVHAVDTGALRETLRGFGAYLP